MVLVPSVIHTGAPEKGCILLSQLNETVTVSASLESIRENRSLFTDLVVEKDLFNCFPFTVSVVVWLKDKESSIPSRQDVVSECLGLSSVSSS